MKASIDAAACIGCGLCANDCPEVFEMNGDKATAKGAVPAGKEEAAKTAAANCPVQCIKVE